MMLTVKCPSCGHEQKTDPKNVSKSVKRCVYCGKSFKVHTHVSNSRIVTNS